jgi:hypothetical protein
MKDFLVSVSRKLAITATLSVVLSSPGHADGLQMPPYKLGRQGPPPYTHIQVDNQRRGIAIRVESSTRAIAYAIAPDGSARHLSEIDGRVEGIQVSPGHDRAYVYVKDRQDGIAISRWNLSTGGDSWVLKDPDSALLEIDDLPDGSVLLAEKLTKGVALQFRSPDGAELGRIDLPAEVFDVGDDDSSGNPLMRFVLLRDGSGVIERRPAVRVDGSERTALVTRFWGGETLTSWIPGTVGDYRGFDRNHIFIQGKGGSLFVTAAGGKPHQVDLDDQTVRLDWAGDGTLRMFHGNGVFTAETYLHANGQAKAQWVRPYRSLAAGFRRSALGPPVENLARAASLSGQSWWSGTVRTSYLSRVEDDMAMVVVLDGTDEFTPHVYPWPDGVAYSPDMRWLLQMDAEGRYRITPARAMDESEAVSMLKKFQAP